MPRNSEDLVIFLGAPLLAKLPGREGILKNDIVHGIAGLAGTPAQLTHHPIPTLGRQCLTPDSFCPVIHSNVSTGAGCVPGSL
jgi:hypothetical protein